MNRSAQLSFTDHRMKTGRGGPRPGAGRPAAPRARVLHRERVAVPKGCPVHVTLRARPGVPSLRSRKLVREFRRSLRRGCERGSYRVVHYSLQKNHCHLLVEAAGKQALAAGMKSTAARLARAVNRVAGRRGAVLDGRYHASVLRTPRQVRAALRYVLLNVKKHGPRLRAAGGLDPASSGRWFDGWRETASAARAAARDPLGDARETASPKAWLLTTGWRRHGRIGLREVPGARRALEAV